MLHKNWITAIFISLAFFAYFIPSVNLAQAACTSASCAASCSPRSGTCRSGACFCTNSTNENCGGYSACRRDGAKCYQTRWCSRKVNGATVSTWYQIAECSCGPVCKPVVADCSNACGLPRRCTSNGCGGENCCAATAPCQPTVKPATPTPRIYCGPNQACPIGQECYQPPMPPCTSGGCIQSMPAKYCRPVECPKRPQGDANCDQLINDADFIVIKSAMKGLKYAALNHSADFNNNNKVDLVDYEIWRNTFKQ